MCVVVDWLFWGCHVVVVLIVVVFVCVWLLIVCFGVVTLLLF